MHGLVLASIALSGLLIPLLLSLLEDSESRSDTSRQGPLPDLLAWGLSCWSSSLSQLRCRFLFSVSISEILARKWATVLLSQAEMSPLKALAVARLPDHFAETQYGKIPLIYRRVWRYVCAISSRLRHSLSQYSTNLCCGLLQSCYAPRTMFQVNVSAEKQTVTGRLKANRQQAEYSRSRSVISRNSRHESLRKQTSLLATTVLTPAYQANWVSRANKKFFRFRIPPTCC